jgi:hypothetical protein
MIKPAATNLTIDWAQHSHFLPKDTHEVNLHVWLAKAAAEGDIAMKLNNTEPSVQAYIAGGYQAERTEPLCCSSDGNVSFARSAERQGRQTAFA